jgi:hypothetical protein
MKAVLLALVLLSGFLPACYVAAALPALWITQRTLPGDPGVIFASGGVDLTMVDGVIVALILRTLYTIFVTRQVALDRPLYLALGVFFLVNFLATLAAGAKFGLSPMLRSAISLTRLATEAALVPILAQSITSREQARRCLQIVLGTLLVLALIQFVNFFGASRGFAIGEVQGAERGELRYFGPVGDSVGFVLLLGYVAALCAARPVPVLLFAGGILLTAGIGALLGLVVATALVVLLGFDREALRAASRRWLWLAPVAGLVALIATATIARPLAGTLIDRLRSGKFQQSGGQRKASATLGVRMFTDNPLTGVGFMGYNAALERYGGKEFFSLAKIDGGSANTNNQWLQALTDSGVPGLCAFLAVVAAGTALFLRVSRRCDDPLLRIGFRAAAIWLLAQAFGNLAAVWMVPSSFVARFLWVLLGIAVAVEKLTPWRDTLRRVPDRVGEGGVEPPASAGGSLGHDGTHPSRSLLR